MKPSPKARGRSRAGGQKPMKGVKVKGRAAGDRPGRGRKAKPGRKGLATAKTSTLKSRESILDGMKRVRSSCPKGVSPREVARREAAKRAADNTQKHGKPTKQSKAKVSGAGGGEWHAASSGVPCLPGAESAAFKALMGGGGVQHHQSAVVRKLVFGKGTAEYVDSDEGTAAAPLSLVRSAGGGGADKKGVQQALGGISGGTPSGAAAAAGVATTGAKRSGSSGGEGDTNSSAKKKRKVTFGSSGTVGGSSCKQDNKKGSSSGSGWGDVAEFGEVVERPSEYLQLLGERIAARRRKNKSGQLVQ